MVKRQSNFELLRIVAMVMIIFHHFAYHGGFVWDFSTITIEHLWYNLIIMGGKIGVNIFVLISGYFLILNKDKIVNLFRKMLKLWGQIFFYSLLFFASTVENL